MASKKGIKLALAALFPTLSVATVASAIAVYRKVFARYERPDYSLIPGEYLYSRIESGLPRREFTFKPHTHALKGYFYPSSKAKGTVILRHGIHSGADDYLPLTEGLVRRGYNVFTYDATGTYESEGESTVGMCQAIIDLEACVKYLRENGALDSSPLYLIGHSWGAYAVTSALCSVDGISGVAAISGMNNGVNMISDKAREYVKPEKLVDFPEAVFGAYQKLLFGKYTEMCAVDGINRAAVPTLIAHGVDDSVVRFDRHSIVSEANAITNPKARYYLGKGLCGGHDSIWHSPSAVAYQMEIESEMNLIRMKEGGKLTDGKKAELYATVDHRKYSAPSEELLDRIDATFLEG